MPRQSARGVVIGTAVLVTAGVVWLWMQKTPQSAATEPSAVKKQSSRTRSGEQPETVQLPSQQAAVVPASTVPAQPPQTPQPSSAHASSGEERLALEPGGATEQRTAIATLRQVFRDSARSNAGRQPCVAIHASALQTSSRASVRPLLARTSDGDTAVTILRNAAAGSAHEEQSEEPAQSTIAERQGTEEKEPSHPEVAAEAKAEVKETEVKAEVKAQDRPIIEVKAEMNAEDKLMMEVKAEVKAEAEAKSEAEEVKAEEAKTEVTVPGMTAGLQAREAVENEPALQRERPETNGTHAADFAIMPETHVSSGIVPGGETEETGDDHDSSEAGACSGSATVVCQQHSEPEDLLTSSDVDAASLSSLTTHQEISTPSTPTNSFSSTPSSPRAYRAGRMGSSPRSTQSTKERLKALKRELRACVQSPTKHSKSRDIMEVIEEIATTEAPIAKKAIEKHRGLPAKYLLKQFFASFKEYREHLKRVKNVKLEALVQALDESREEGEAGKQVEALLALVLYYTSVQAYVTALEMAQQAREVLANLSAEDKASVDRASLAQLQDVVATYLHLNNDLAAAGEFYRDALKALDEAEAAHAAAEEPSEEALQRIKYLQSFVNVKYGALLVDADQPEEARQYYDRAVELDPENADVYVHRSQLWHSLKEPERSQADLEMAVAKDPTVASSYVRLAASCLQVPESLQLNLEEAVSYLQKAKALAPTDVNVACLEVEISFVQGQVEEALELADRAAELDPDNALPLISQIRMRRTAAANDGQDPHELIDLCDRILRIDPHDEFTYVQKAQLLLQVAQTREEAVCSVEVCKQAIHHCRHPEKQRILITEREAIRAKVLQQFPR